MALQKNITSASRPCKASASGSPTTLPSDLDIFSPICSIPLCIQICASSCPRAARVCAASFSWCGNIRSLPPPWMSKPTPSNDSAIAEHSMCQPVARGPGRIPGGVLALLLGLPEREVQRILLQRRALDALA